MEPSGSGGSNLSVDGVFFAASSGGFISLVSISACLCTKCLLSFTFGQTPRTWIGAPISDCQVASGLWDTRQAALSIYARERLAVQLGLCQFRSPLRGRTVAVFCDKPQLCIPFARGVAPGLLSSPPWLRRSCARWSPSPSACLHSSFRAPTPS